MPEEHTPTVRKNTSASNIFRRALCPGSARMEDGIAEKDSLPAEEGKLLHSLYMTGIRPAVLTPDQADVLDHADRLTMRFVDQFRSQLGIPEEAESRIEREVPLIVHNLDGSELFPGHSDYVRTWPEWDARVVVDAKFGFMEVEHAAENTQLASYGIGKYDQSKVKHTGVAIVQPRNFGPQMSTAIYTSKELEAARAELSRIVAETQDPTAPLVAGDKQCHFCKAKVFCPAYQEKFASLVTVGVRALDQVTNEELAKLKEAIQFAGKISDDVNAELRSRIEAGRMPGWKLRNAGDVREVTNLRGLFDAFAATFKGNPLWSNERFAQCRAIVWGKLEEYVAELAGLSEKKAKAFVKELTAPFVKSTPKAKTPVRDTAAQKEVKTIVIE